MGKYDKELVESLYPGTTIYKAMRFWSLPKNKTDMFSEMASNGDYYAQTKKDGNWYAFTKSVTGEMYLFSRGVSVKTNLPVEGIDKVPHLKEAFADLPNDTIILGEIYYPGETTAAVRSIMGCLPPRAIKRQKEKGNIHFYMFDVIRYNGEDLTRLGSYERYKKLVKIAEEFDLVKEEVELADCVTNNIEEFAIDNFAKGEEGTILKKKDAVYVGGKAPAWSSIKWKKQDDADVVCIGFEDPTRLYTGKELEVWEYWEKDGKKYRGQFYGEKGYEPVTKPYFHDWKMSIEFGLYKGEEIISVGTVSSGMNDKLREQAATHPEKFIGKTMRISYMEITDEAIREPVFLGFRDDKPAQECLYEDVFK